jgi:hypothetical protein
MQRVEDVQPSVAAGVDGQAVAIEVMEDDYVGIALTRGNRTAAAP